MTSRHPGGFDDEETPAPESSHGSEGDPTDLDEVHARRAAARMADEGEREERRGGPVFNGTGDYAAWKEAVKAKGAYIAGASKRTAYIFGQLRPPATGVALAGTEVDEDSDSSIPFTKPSLLFAALEVVYGTSTAQDKTEAVMTLSRLYQGSKNLDDFLASFTPLAFTAGIDAEQKVAMLMAKVSRRLQPTMLMMSDHSSYPNVIAMLKRADRHLPAEKVAPRAAAAGKPARARGAKEAKDKAPKDLSNVECYKCHKKGHYKNKCPDNTPHAHKAEAEDVPDIEEITGEF